MRFHMIPYENFSQKSRSYIVIHVDSYIRIHVNCYMIFYRDFLNLDCQSLVFYI